MFILWWLGLIRFRDFGVDPGFLTLALAPVWTTWRWAIVAYASLEIVVDLIAIARPGWTLTNGAVSIARYLVGIGILSQVVQAGHWLVVGGPALAEHAQLSLQTNFDLGMKIGIGVAIAGMAFRIAQEVWRLYVIRQAQVLEPRPA